MLDENFVGDWMTSRTIDIHCRNCRTYLYSEWPDVSLEELRKVVFCNRKPCEEAATVAKLEGKDVKVYEDV